LVVGLGNCTILHVTLLRPYNRNGNQRTGGFINSTFPVVPA